RAGGHVAARGRGSLRRLEGGMGVRIDGAADGGGAVLRAADVEVRIAPDAGVRRHDVDGPALPVDDDLVLDPAVGNLAQPRHLDEALLPPPAPLLAGATV